MLNILYLKKNEDGAWMDHGKFTIDDENELHRFLNRVIQKLGDEWASADVTGTTSIQDSDGNWHIYRPAKVQESY